MGGRELSREEEGEEQLGFASATVRLGCMVSVWIAGLYIRRGGYLSPVISVM